MNYNNSQSIIASDIQSLRHLYATIHKELKKSKFYNEEKIKQIYLDYKYKKSQFGKAMELDANGVDVAKEIKYRTFYTTFEETNFSYEFFTYAAEKLNKEKYYLMLKYKAKRGKKDGTDFRSLGKQFLFFEKTKLELELAIITNDANKLKNVFDEFIDPKKNEISKNLYNAFLTFLKEEKKYDIKLILNKGIETLENNIKAMNEYLTKENAKRQIKETKNNILKKIEDMNNTSQEENNLEQIEKILIQITKIKQELKKNFFSKIDIEIATQELDLIRENLNKDKEKKIFVETKEKLIEEYLKTGLINPWLIIENYKGIPQLNILSSKLEKDNLSLDIKEKIKSTISTIRWYIIHYGRNKLDTNNASIYIKNLNLTSTDEEKLIYLLSEKHSNLTNSKFIINLLNDWYIKQDYSENKVRERRRQDEI